MPLCETIVEEWTVCWITEEWVDDPAAPNPADVYFSLDVSGNYTLGERISMTVTGFGASHTITNIELSMSNSEFHINQCVIYSGSAPVYSTLNTQPGAWTYDAKITYIQNGVSKTKSVNFKVVRNIQFPDVATIKSNVQSKMDDAWTKTKTSTDAENSYEYGCYIYIITRPDSYEYDCTPTGQATPVPGRASFKFPAMAEQPNLFDPKAGGKFYVGEFHTHPHDKYIAEALGSGLRRPVGRSDGDGDPLFGAPGFVYDYVGSGGYIYSTDAINSNGKIYEYGGERRTKIKK